MFHSPFHCVHTTFWINLDCPVISGLSRDRFLARSRSNNNNRKRKVKNGRRWRRKLIFGTILCHWRKYRVFLFPYFECVWIFFMALNRLHFINVSQKIAQTNHRSNSRHTHAYANEVWRLFGRKVFPRMGEYACTSRHVRIYYGIVNYYV